MHLLFTPITWFALSAGALWASDSEVGVTGSVIFRHNKAFADGGEKGRGMQLRYRFKGLRLYNLLMMWPADSKLNWFATRIATV